MLLGAGPDCITGLVTRINCDVYHGGHSEIVGCLYRAFLCNNGQHGPCAAYSYVAELVCFGCEYK